MRRRSRRHCAERTAAAAIARICYVRVAEWSVIILGSVAALDNLCRIKIGVGRVRSNHRKEKDLLPFRLRGGARPGAGRKPNGERAGVSHAQRGAVSGREPVHVTAKLSRGLPRLRSKREYAALRRAFAA